MLVINKNVNVVTCTFCLFMSLFLVCPSGASQNNSQGDSPSQTKTSKETLGTEQPSKVNPESEIRNTRQVAILLQKADKFQRAAQLYHEIAEEMNWVNGRATYLYSEAQAYWAAGDYSKARELFLHISNDGARGLKAYIPEALSKEEKEKRERTILQYWIDIDHARFALINIAQLQGDINRAIEICRIIEKDSPNVENQRRAVFVLSQIEKRQGDMEKSAQLLEKLIIGNTKTDMPPNLGYTGLEFSGSQSYGMDSRYGIFPPEESFLIDDARILLALTDIYEREKNYKKLVETYEALIKKTKDGERRQTYLFLLGKAYVQAGFPGKAQEAYLEIIDDEKDRLEKRKEFFNKRNKNMPLKMMGIGKIAQEELELLRLNKP
jgi:tetratricopeptide (TPR) repeat protein